MGHLGLKEVSFFLQQPNTLPPDAALALYVSTGTSRAGVLVARRRVARMRVAVAEVWCRLQFCRSKEATSPSPALAHNPDRRPGLVVSWLREQLPPQRRVPAVLARAGARDASRAGVCTDWHLPGATGCVYGGLGRCLPALTAGARLAGLVAEGRGRGGRSALEGP